MVVAPDLPGSTLPRQDPLPCKPHFPHSFWHLGSISFSFDSLSLWFMRMSVGADQTLRHRSYVTCSAEHTRCGRRGKAGVVLMCQKGTLQYSWRKGSLRANFIWTNLTRLFKSDLIEKASLIPRYDMSGTWGSTKYRLLWCVLTRGEGGGRAESVPPL